jgi:hypothetical protein
MINQPNQQNLPPETEEWSERYEALRRLKVRRVYPVRLDQTQASSPLPNDMPATTVSPFVAKQRTQR